MKLADGFHKKFSRKAALSLTCASGGPAMVGRLLICIGQFDHFAIIIRASQKADSGGKAVARKSRRDRNRRHKY